MAVRPAPGRAPERSWSDALFISGVEVVFKSLAIVQRGLTTVLILVLFAGIVFILVPPDSSGTLKSERRVINHPDGSNIELIIANGLIKELRWSTPSETVFRHIYFANRKWHMVECDKSDGSTLWHNVTME